MKLGRVIGTVVATTVVDGLEGVRLLVVQPLDKQSKPKGRPVVAADGLLMAGPDNGQVSQVDVRLGNPPLIIKPLANG